MTQTTPLFTIEHDIEVEGTPEEVWAVLVDFDRYAEWNPYVLSLTGSLEPGSTLSVIISQTNWPEPITVTPIVVRAEPNEVLHWRGRIGDGGILDTDHSFHIELISVGRIHFVQREAFRGSLAETMDEETRAFTRDAFQAMNEALAERLRALKP